MCTNIKFEIHPTLYSRVLKYILFICFICECFKYVYLRSEIVAVSRVFLQLFVATRLFTNIHSIHFYVNYSYIIRLLYI